MKKTLIAGIIVVVIIIIVVVTQFAGQGDTKAVTVATVNKGTVDSSVLASGTLVYRERVNLRPQVMGKVSAVPVEEGDSVKKGQIVVRIDPETLKAQVATEEANVRMAEIAIKQQKLKIDNLKTDWQRKKKLHDQGLIDSATYDTARNQLAIARTELASRKQALLLNKAQLAKAKEQLSRTIIRSPLNGIVTQVDIKAGETVIAGTTNIVGSALMTIADPSAMFADVRVDEADIAHIELGQRVDITAVAYPNATLKGKVTFIGTSATVAEGQTGLSFEVKVLLADNKNIDLRPGMSCRAEIHTSSRHNTLAIPIQSVLYTAADRRGASRNHASGYVFMVANGHVKKHTITTGLSNESKIVVLDGLKVGDKIVTGPYKTLHSLKNGEAVKIMTGAFGRGRP